MRLPRIDTQTILAMRPQVDRPAPGESPLSYFLEREPSHGSGEDVQCLTVLLRGSECQFKCLMCDLWKGTHPGSTPPGVIPAQLQEATSNSPQRADWIKLYNASNFFSTVNIPQQDLPSVAKLVEGYDRVIVENHPRVLNDGIESFRARLNGQLEIAMGLETIHPDILPALNKQMTCDDFQRACEWLLDRSVDLRAFVLLRPPGLSEAEGVEWCLRSIEFAESCGVRHVSVIPVRSGNGTLEMLESQGHFHPPVARSLEFVMAHSLNEYQPVVTVDLWNWELLRGTCNACSDARRQRLEKMNLGQHDVPYQALCDCSTMADL